MRWQEFMQLLPAHIGINEQVSGEKRFYKIFFLVTPVIFPHWQEYLSPAFWEHTRKGFLHFRLLFCPGKQDAIMVSLASHECILIFCWPVAILYTTYIKYTALTGIFSQSTILCEKSRNLSVLQVPAKFGQFILSLFRFKIPPYLCMRVNVTIDVIIYQTAVIFFRKQKNLGVDIFMVMIIIQLVFIYSCYFSQSIVFCEMNKLPI